jgi:hypothetical protein
MKIFQCWTQNPQGPTASFKTEAAALAWATQQDRAKACGYVLMQRRVRKQSMPVEIYNIAKQRWAE